MLLIPAIDLKGGNCVRLRQGRMDDDTVFSDDPVATARRWVEAGAQRLHVVDLDGAVQGEPVNAAAIADICATFPDLEVQVGGGIRDEEQIEVYIQAGVRYVIIGTQAVKAPGFVADAAVSFPGHILVGIDARDGKVATEGWSKLSRHDPIDLAQRFAADGIEAIIYTDISRDGMLSGPNIEATVALAQAVPVPVIASGGIANLEQVLALKAHEGDGIVGAITGRAIYEGSLDYASARALVEG
ncbi:MAG: 1-(5-phosphoribosyl)-5-[(5-phosphoribosylamino)methylideneamino]imidazole-4-carboxamide isomerase [Acidithiobacillus sp.]|uniref:1-(5-phosphoribosyl)-5-[(5- phosphoribosylamino)methylideneamino]imidazole-4- carboxamide isomerase n=1 Tax=Acidithiobacillus sp. TaxID=1872118 RepID=UPI003D007F36